MYTILQSFLDKIGLSKQEALLYLTALEAGPSRVADLARRAGIHRVATYALVERLEQKGLMRETASAKRPLVEAVHPREIEQLLKKQKRAIRKLELKFDELLPEFLQMYNRCAVRPRIQLYEGLAGLERMNQDIIETLKELPVKERVIYSYSNPSAIQKTFEGYIDQEDGFVTQRVLHQIKNNVIAPDNQYNETIHKRDSEHLRDMVLVPEKLFPFKNDMTLYHTKVAMQGFQHEFAGVIIESQEMHDDQFAIFQLAWRGARIHVSL